MFSSFFIYTPMEVVCPVGMFVYTAVYKLAADGAVFDTHEKKSMVRGTPKRKPRYLISRFMFNARRTDTQRHRHSPGRIHTLTSRLSLVMSPAGAS